MATLSFPAPLNSARQHPADQLHQGTKTVIQFRVTRPDGVTAFALTGLTPTFRAKRDPRDASYLFSKTGTVTDSPGGLCEATLLPSDLPVADELWAELVLAEAGGDVVGTVTYWLPVQRGLV